MRRCWIGTVRGVGNQHCATSGRSALTVTSLNVAPAGRFDITDNALVIDYAGPSPIANIQALLRTGFNAGAWTGKPIVYELGDDLTVERRFDLA